MSPKCTTSKDADVKLHLYSIDGSEAKLAAELQVPYHAVRNVKQDRSVHRHADGTAHVHVTGASLVVKQATGGNP